MLLLILSRHFLGEGDFLKIFSTSYYNYFQSILQDANSESKKITGQKTKYKLTQSVI